MQFGLLVHEGCFGSAVASVIDIMRVADEVRERVDPTIRPIELSIASARKRVGTTTSMTLTADRSLKELGASMSSSSRRSER